MSPLLSVNNLTISFHSETGLIPGVQDINLEVRRNEIVALVGESGSGKSITALSVMQLLPAPPAKYLSGEILFTDSGNHRVDLLKQSFPQMKRIRGSQIAMIFQEPMSSLNPVLTCGEQVVEAIRAHEHIRYREARELTIELFGKVRLPDPAAIFSHYPHQLSGGQKQRIMIAMAMSGHPSLLICDEPTTALDVTVQQTILQLIRELQQTENMGVLFITHDLGVVAEIADRALVMYKGRIVEEGPVQELFLRPKHPYTKGLLNCRPILHAKGKRLPVVSDFMGHKVHHESPKPVVATTDREPLIQVEHCRVWYPAKKSFLGRPLSYTKAVDDVSFEIYRGETLGLVGESGCGKTTLGRAVLRLITPDAGRILFEGADLADYSGAALQKLRKDIQIVFQDPYSSLNPRLTIGSAIAEPLKVHGLVATEKQRRARVEEWLERVDLKADHFNRYPHEFSGGQRQRIVIARALIMEPSFVVCDESVSALDVSVQAQVINLLNDLKKDLGFTVLFISHDLSVVKYISDRILVMNKGRIEETGPAEEVFLHPKTAYTQRLISSIPGFK